MDATARCLFISPGAFEDNLTLHNCKIVLRSIAPCNPEQMALQDILTMSCHESGELKCSSVDMLLIRCLLRSDEIYANMKTHEQGKNFSQTNYRLHGRYVYFHKQPDMWSISSKLDGRGNPGPE